MAHLAREVEHDVGATVGRARTSGRSVVADVGFDDDDAGVGVGRLTVGHEVARIRRRGAGRRASITVTSAPPRTSAEREVRSDEAESAGDDGTGARQRRRQEWGPERGQVRGPVVRRRDPDPQRSPWRTPAPRRRRPATTRARPRRRRRADVLTRVTSVVPFERAAVLDADRRATRPGSRRSELVLDRLERAGVVHVIEHVEVARAQWPRTATPRRRVARRAPADRVTRRPPADSPYRSWNSSSSGSGRPCSRSMNTHRPAASTVAPRSPTRLASVARPTAVRCRCRRSPAPPTRGTRAWSRSRGR